MSHVLNSLLNSTFALLLENEKNGDDCEHLVVNLEEHIEKLRKGRISNDLHTSLTNLKCAVDSLRSCFGNRNQCETRESQVADRSKNESELSESQFKQRSELPGGNSKGIVRPEAGDVNTTPHSACAEDMRQANYKKEWKDAQLAKEVREIEADNEYKSAVGCFQESNTFAATVIENEDETEAAKITATKVLVICEILGSLQDLDTAAKNCIKHISQLHGIRRLSKAPFPVFETVKHFVEKKLGFTENIQGMDAIVHINVVVFQFMKEFIGKPVAILDWPIFDVISQESYVESYHPILGKPSPKVATPDPFTFIDRGKLPIDCKFSVVNCCGEIFTKDRRLGGIIRVTPSQHMKRELYSIHEFDTEISSISSMSVDCSDCTSQAGEASPSTSNAVGRAPSNTECKGKIYILARCESEGKVRYLLYVMDMKGNIECTNKLPFLERNACTDEGQLAKIFCVKDKKAIILDVTRRNMHILQENTDSRITKYRKTLQLTQFGNVDVSTNPLCTVSYNNEMVCAESRSKFIVYSIVIDEENSQLTKTGEIETRRLVQDVAYNHESEEFIVLCYTIYLLRHHLVIYSKDGQINRDIELYNGNYRYARLISHHNGSVILLDNDKLLHLKSC